MADDWLTTLQRAGALALDTQFAARALSNDLRRVGLDVLAERTSDVADALDAIRRDVDEGTGAVLSESLATSQVHTANVFSAVLAGMGVAKDNPGD